MLTEDERQYFDTQLELVLPTLPADVKRLIDQIPIVVEDRASRKLLNDLGIESPEELLGLYRGVSLDKQSIDQSGVLPEIVNLFRIGILAHAADRRGRITDAALQNEIRTTILHEYGHHFGLDDDELEAMGY